MGKRKRGLTPMSTPKRIKSFPSKSESDQNTPRKKRCFTDMEDFNLELNNLKQNITDLPTKKNIDLTSIPFRINQFKSIFENKIKFFPHNSIDL